MLLLVSVTNLQEAMEAHKGGADILDLKNPSEGSLGAPHSSMVHEVCNYFNGKAPVSVALGDLPHLPGTASLAALGAAGCGTDYIKIGLHGSDTPSKAASMLHAVAKASGNAKPIAAAYGDYKTSGTLDPLLLPPIAHGAGFYGCMIDTYNKSGKNLFDYLSPDLLSEFIDKCSTYGLISALAGSLKIGDLTRLKKLKPDIIGVRGAVCENNEREAQLEVSGVVRFKDAMQAREM